MRNIIARIEDFIKLGHQRELFLDFNLPGNRIIKDVYRGLPFQY
jgi:hypothetical protein